MEPWKFGLDAESASFLQSARTSCSQAKDEMLGTIREFALMVFSRSVSCLRKTCPLAWARGG